MIYGQRVLTNYFRPVQGLRLAAQRAAEWAEANERAAEEAAQRAADAARRHERRQEIARAVNAARAQAWRDARAQARAQAQAQGLPAPPDPQPPIVVDVEDQADNLGARGIPRPARRLPTPDNFAQLVEVYNRVRGGTPGVRAVRQAFRDMPYVTAQSDRTLRVYLNRWAKRLRRDPSWRPNTSASAPFYGPHVDAAVKNRVDGAIAAGTVVDDDVLQRIVLETLEKPEYADMKRHRQLRRPRRSLSWRRTIAPPANALTFPATARTCDVANDVSVQQSAKRGG